MFRMIQLFQSHHSSKMAKCDKFDGQETEIELNIVAHLTFWMTSRSEGSRVKPCSEPSKVPEQNFAQSPRKYLNKICSEPLKVPKSKFIPSSPIIL